MDSTQPESRRVLVLIPGAEYYVPESSALEVYLSTTEIRSNIFIRTGQYKYNLSPYKPGASIHISKDL